MTPTPSDASDDAPEPPERAPDEVGGRYAQYVLGVLVLVYILNFLDRQIISILAEKIRADLGIDDAQIGFLYGTAFAVFYAIFGIPLGRLADVWVRKRLIALGLAVWSAMTAVSGFAQNFGQLAFARIGVGIGEASATPAAFSMLSDSFPAARRATALAIYSSGIYLGAGLGLFLGGSISSAWDAAYPSGGAPLGLAGWQMAYLAVGTPGILLAIWVATLREPVRGRVDGIRSVHEPHPFRVFGREMLAVIPLLSLVNLALTKAPPRVLAANLAAAGGLVLVAWLLIQATGDVAQWVALAIGLYSAISWAQSLALRDAPSFRLIFGTRTLLLVALGFSCLSFVGYSAGFWSVPYAVRELGVDEAQAGLWLGGSGAAGGFLGVTLGGVLADRFRMASRSGRLYVGIINAVLPFPVAWWMFHTESVTTFYVLSLPLNVMLALWIGPGATTVQDLVLPRMRGTASAAYLMVITFVGLALGPYTVGRISVASGDLAFAILAGFGMLGVGLVLIALAIRSLPADEGSIRDRARAAGEVFEESA